MKNDIKLVILPLYRNNWNYPYYSFNSLRSKQDTLNLPWLEKELPQLYFKFNVLSISIEGGEISELSDFYFDLLFRLLKIYSTNITICTSFVNYNRSLIEGADIIKVNYNFNSYSEDTDKVFQNIKAAVSTGKIINLESLDISVESNQLEIITKLNKLGIKTWKINPYQKTEYSQLPNIGYSNYEKIIADYLKLVPYMQFSFINKLEIEGIIKTENFPIKTVYILPTNKFALGSFDPMGNFYLDEYEDLDELEKNLEKLQSKQILLCKDCIYKNECLADKYFNPNYIGNSCSGYKNLIKQTKGK